MVVVMVKTNLYILSAVFAETTDTVFVNTIFPSFISVDLKVRSHRVLPVSEQMKTHDCNTEVVKYQTLI